MVEALLVDQFSLHIRFHLVLQLTTDFKAPVPDSHHLVHLMHGVLTSVISIVWGRLSSSSHICKEVVLSAVIWGLSWEIVQVSDESTTVGYPGYDSCSGCYTTAQQASGRGYAGRGLIEGCHSRCYVFPSRTEAVISDTVITGLSPIFYKDISILFDPDSTNLLASCYFA